MVIGGWFCAVAGFDRSNHDTHNPNTLQHIELMLQREIAEHVASEQRHLDHFDAILPDAALA